MLKAHKRNTRTRWLIEVIFFVVSSTGGWIFDNFPQNKEQFNMLVERGIIPDDVIVFREESTASNILINRWNELHREGKVYQVIVFQWVNYFNDEV